MSKLKLIPAAAPYNAVLPSAGILSAHLESVPHRELSPSMAAGAGFVEIEPFGSLVVTFPGGYAFALRYDEKVIPGSVVKAELKKEAARYEEFEGVKPGRKLLRELKERVVARLCATAMIKTTIVTCLYHTERELLIVPTTSKKLRGAVMGQLVRAVESIKTTTINVSNAKGSLTTRLQRYINDEAGHEPPAFGAYDVGSKVVLAGGQGKVTLDIVELTLAERGINEAIASGAEVTEIALQDEGAEFRLTQDFLLKGIKFGRGEDNIVDCPEDVGGAWAHEASAQLAITVGIVDELCQMFGYVKPTEDSLV